MTFKTIALGQPCVVKFDSSHPKFPSFKFGTRILSHSVKNSQETSSTLAALANPEMNVCVSVVEGVDFGDRQTLPEIDRHLMISYGDICLAVKANSEILIAFTQQVKTDPEYIKDIFRQAMIRLQKCAY